MIFSDFAKTALCRVYQTGAYLPNRLQTGKERAMLKGTGSVNKLPVYIKKKNIDNVLVVTDSTQKNSGALSAFFTKLDDLGIAYRLFGGAGENPTAVTIGKCAEEYVKGGCKAIIAIGGGSAIDCAKLAGIKALNEKSRLDKLNGAKLFVYRKPLIYAVPTTVGSGSECSPYAVWYDKKQKKRNIVKSPFLKPDAAVLDPAMTEKLPKEIIAQTAMSALCRAVEAFVEKGSRKSVSDNALLAVRLIFANAVKAYEENDCDAKVELQKAAYLSGVKAGYAHYGALAVSAVCRVPYSKAAAVLLPEVLRAYGEKACKRLSVLADELRISGETDKEKAENFIAAVEELNRRLSLPTKLKKIKKNSIHKCASEISARCNPSYAAPKQLFYDEIAEILIKVKE